MAKKEKVPVVPTRKAFVIVNINYEYNDEYYYTTENECGKGVKVCFREDRAEQICREMNRKELKGCCTGHYSEGSEEHKEAYESVFGETKQHDYDLVIPAKATTKQLDEYLDNGGLTFYKVEEIEVEMAL